MKKSPISILAVAVLAAALLCIPGCGQQQSGGAAEAGTTSSSQAEQTAPEAKLTIGVMPKLIGIDFFNATGRGAREAAGELGVEIDYDGPVTNDVQLQVQMLETWIAKKYDAIAVAPNDVNAIAPVLKKARKRGITVVTWDADAAPEARDFFANQCTSESVAKTLMDVMAGGIGQDGKYIIMTGSLTADNQNQWMREMDQYRQEKYPDMVNLTEIPKASEEDQALATQVAMDCLKTYPEMQGMFALTSVALPGAAEGLRKEGAANKVFLTGLATPNSMKTYIEDGTVKRFVLWNPVDLGYLAVQVAVAAAKGELEPGAETFHAGRIGDVRVNGTEVILGEPIVFDESNIGEYDF